MAQAKENKYTIDTIFGTEANKIPAVEIYADYKELAETDRQLRLQVSLNALFQLMDDTELQISNIDNSAIDRAIVKIDELMSSQLDQILHHPEMQQYQATWQALNYLLDSVVDYENVEVHILDVSKAELSMDYANALNVADTALYQHVYQSEYDMPGGKPYSVMISDFKFSANAPDIKLMRNVAKIAALAHMPFIAQSHADFFDKDDINQVAQIKDLKQYLSKAEYINWQSLRSEDNSKYLGLTLPRFLLRLPYGDDNPCNSFNYQEQITCDSQLTWGGAAYAFAANLARSFDNYGWLVNIRGIDSGGKLENLPLYQYQNQSYLETKIPTEILIPEARELELAESGFIPLSYYKDTDYACFFSANSIAEPQKFDTDEATANARINCRLPYVFLAARIGHYLKVLQRENIGAVKDAAYLEKELNRWLERIITKMNDPSPELIATHPLRDGHVQVTELADNPGFFAVKLYAVPHFQIEGVDVKLSLVARMPAKQQ